ASWHDLGRNPVFDVLGGFGQADALGGGKRYGMQRADVGQVFAYGEHGALALPVRQLVGLGQQSQHGPARGGDEIGQAAVEFGDAAANVDDEHDAGQRLAVAQVAAEDVGPLFLFFVGDRRIAITGQVDQKAQVLVGRQGVGQPEHVDQAGAAGRLAGKRQPALVAQHIDGRRFAGVGAADEAVFGRAVGGQLVQ